MDWIKIKLKSKKKEVELEDADYASIQALRELTEAIKRSNGSIVGWGYNVHGETNVPSGRNFETIEASNSFLKTLETFPS